MDWEKLLERLIENIGPILVGIGAIMAARKKPKSSDSDKEEDKG